MVFIEISHATINWSGFVPAVPRAGEQVTAANDAGQDVLLTVKTVRYELDTRAVVVVAA